MSRKKEEKINYYTTDKIDSYNADYNIIYGERSNGKTTAILKKALIQFIESGFKDQLGLIRRWGEDLKSIQVKNLFEGINNLGWVEKYTKGLYNQIIYKNRMWFLAKIENNDIVDVLTYPFAYGFSIASQEHYKSSTYPNIKIILFDEYITRTSYLPDEFMQFQQLLSTIIRLKDDVKIYMCGNSINKYCPYHNEMGLKNVKKQLQDTIDLYTYGESNLRVAVEYSQGIKKESKKSNKYFAFDNPKLQMITNGKWEIDIYPHLPHKYKPKDIKFIYYIVFDGDILQCEIIKSYVYKSYFTFIHRKTTPINDDFNHIVFSDYSSPNKNYRRKITKLYDDLGKKIYSFYVKDKVFYQDNEVGDIIYNYLLWCKKESV